MRIADILEDESEPSTGEEIGAALSDAMDKITEANREALTKIAQSNESLATMLAMSIAEALRSIDSRHIVIESADREVQQWTFDVKRDSAGRMTQIVATAKPEGATR